MPWTWPLLLLSSVSPTMTAAGQVPIASWPALVASSHGLHVCRLSLYSTLCMRHRQHCIQQHCIHSTVCIGAMVAALVHLVLLSCQQPLAAQFRRWLEERKWHIPPAAILRPPLPSWSSTGAPACLWPAAGPAGGRRRGTPGWRERGTRRPRGNS